jgi:hypothetical protein
MPKQAMMMAGQTAEASRLRFRLAVRDGMAGGNLNGLSFAATARVTSPARRPGCVKAVIVTVRSRS